jgi:hypothetical protein
MTKGKQKQVEELKKKLKRREEVELVADFSSLFSLAIFIAVAVISFVAGRIYADKIVILILTNVLSIWMMVSAAQVLVRSQQACMILTDRRMLGNAGTKDCDLPYKDIKAVHTMRDGLFIDTGDPHTSFTMRYLKNRREVFNLIQKHRKRFEK